MAKTINQAFEEYMRDCVNLDADVTSKARESRNNLLDNIAEFDNDDDFFDLCTNFNVHFGSFSRKTQCRPLDDIDLMIGIAANGATYNSDDPWNNVRITASISNNAQWDCRDTYGYLNSKKVVNMFKNKLTHVREYSRSEIKPAGEAVVLNLTSKEWAFDIVPCFHTVVESSGRDYYLIPNAEGNWQKTDPTIDRVKVEAVNQSKNGRLLDLVRLVKKWNESYFGDVALPSYLLETMIVNHCECSLELSADIGLRFATALLYITQNITNPVWDMKNIQGNINLLTDSAKALYSKLTSSCCELALSALKSGFDGLNEIAINTWKTILGEEFPDFE